MNETAQDLIEAELLARGYEPTQHWQHRGVYGSWRNLQRPDGVQAFLASELVDAFEAWIAA